MKTIKKYKEVLWENLKNDVIKNYKMKQKGKIELVSYEEDIALWKITNVEKGCLYFYTDLNGNVLFDTDFSYATPFSSGKACIFYERYFHILDLDKKEIISFPSELEKISNCYSGTTQFAQLNGMRHDNIAIFDEESFKWGGFKYNSSEKTFKQNIPYIWDTLEFSRLKDWAYVGLHTKSGIVDNYPYSHWSDDNGTLFTLSNMIMPIGRAQDLICYELRKKFYLRGGYQDVVKFINEEIENTVPIENRDQIIKSYIKKAYNIADDCFEENCQEELNNNYGNVVEVGNIKEYTRKLGRLVK